MASLLDINGISGDETAQGEGADHGEDVGGSVAIRQTSHLNIGNRIRRTLTPFTLLNSRKAK